MINPYSFGWGYIEVGNCERCYTPAHLFAHSFIEGEVKCERCISYSLRRYVDYNACSEGMREGLLLSANDLPSLSPDKFPLVASTPTCDACERPEGVNVWRFIEAVVTNNDESTERQLRTIIVHAKCTLQCDDCNTAIASPNQRIGYRDDWKVSTSDFIEINRLDGDDRCAPCATAYKQEMGGDFYWCDSCEGEWHEGYTRWYCGERYCSDCIDTHAYECDDCGQDCWEGDDHYCESDDDDDDGNSPIHSYSYRPSPAFFGKGKYYLGFELEVETRNSSRYEGAELAQNVFGAHVYLKDDGSLNDGFEIVTHPHTLTEYQTNFNWAGLNKLKNQGLRSWNTSTCGLHVHVSRTAFDVEGVRLSYEQRILRRQAHELRFMKLIYDNERQVCRIAGRSGNHYATFSDKGKLIRKVKNGVQENGRYSAINTENDDTLEVRVFKGSLRPERVLSALEFVTASVEYTRDLPINGKNNALSWLRFTGYVAQHAETYPNLALIMNESFNSDYPAQQD